MKVIAGLGNPGEKYKNTRHNAGFILLDLLAEQENLIFKFESKFNAEIARFDYKNEQVMFVKPQTFMNLSGSSIKELINFYKLNNEDVLIIYDDISLNTGSLRYRPSGSDGGHNGVKSIIYNLNTDIFDRLKIGIGPQPSFMASEAYVLQNFSKEQIPILKDTFKTALISLFDYLDSGITFVQNKYNKK